MNKEKLSIIPLGGIGDVTKNMYLYEYFPEGKKESEILIIDCGIGFPDIEMYGIDLAIPDISYLRNKQDRIKGILLSHGHEDHIGALPYLLPQLNAPVYATSLTAALAEMKLREFDIKQQVKHINPDKTLHLGSFKVEVVPVTHSIPDAVNFIIHTKIGTVYHGSDFKFDWTPVDGKITDIGKIAKSGNQGILCLLSDCVRVEKEGHTLSERIIEQTLEAELRTTKGKFIVTTQSSNVSRLQQAINVGLKYGRKIAILGRSIEQVIKLARKLNYIHLPKSELVFERQIAKYPPQSLLILAAGSQGQVNSALSRIAHEDNKYVKVKPGDKIVFSSDPIPGNEKAVYTLIDQLTRQGADVVYTDILEDLHVSGHASANDLRLMIALTKPRYLIPIGGTYRHMQRYRALATEMGYHNQQILLLDNGQVATFTKHQEVNLDRRIPLKPVFVDSLGVKDISHVVLRDRQQMAADGLVIIIVPINSNTGRLATQPDIITRGFVKKQEVANLIPKTKEEIKRQVAKIVRKKSGKIVDWRFIKQNLTEKLEEFLYRQTKRRPLVLCVVVEI